MKTKTNTQKNDVLFQKLGNVWYAFSEIDGEVVYTALPAHIDPKTTKLELYTIIEEHMQNVAQLQSRRERSAEAA